MYIYKKVYILNMFIYTTKLYEYKYRHANTFKYFLNIYCMYVYLYIHKNIHSTHIYYVNKTFILDAINRN